MKAADPLAPRLALRLFGPFEARVGENALPHLRTRRGEWLLALLALRAGHGYPRSGWIERGWLAGTLWLESSEAQALSNLRVSLTDLRHALGAAAGCLRAPSPRSLALDLAAVEIDLLAFDAAVARGDPASLEQAAALYRGPLLEGCGEEWAFQERQAREHAYLAARERLETEHDNLRAALEWALAQEDAAVGLRLAGSLFHFWGTRGYITEGRGRLAGLLALAGEEGTAARARALIGAGELAWLQGDAGAARSLLGESLTLGQALGNQWIIADALILLGMVDSQQGDYPAARSRWEESLALGRERDDRWIVAVSLYLLAYLLSDQEGDYGTARSLAEEALALGRELGDRMILAGSRWALARIALQQNDPQAARSLAAEGLVPARELGDKHLVAIVLDDLGDAALDLEEYPAARASYEESLTIQREIGVRHGIAYSLDRLGHVAMEEGNAEAARALYEESLAIRREIDDRPGIAWSLGGVGHVAREAGEFARCAALYRESMALRQTLEDRSSIAQGLEDFAGLAGRQQQWERAVRLLGAAEGVAELVGRSLPLSVRTEYQRTVDGARAALGEAAFAAAWAAGRAMSLEEAVEYALAEPTDA